MKEHIEQIHTARSAKYRAICLGIALLLFGLGYVIAPPSMTDGGYNATITFEKELEDQTTFSLTANFNFTVDSSITVAQNLKEVEVSKDNLKLVVSYYEIYSGKMNSRLRLEASIALIDPTSTESSELLEDNSVYNFMGNIAGNSFNFDFFPVDKKGDTVKYEFRILKHSGFVLGLVLAISFLWLSEAISLGATALIVPAIVAIFGIDTPTNALAQFMNPIIGLFLAGFMLALAMKRVGLDEKIALAILARVPSNGKVVVFTMMVLAALFSMVMSNTAAAAILIPLGVTLLYNVDKKYVAFRKTMILGISYSATIGGVGTLIGTPPNLIAVEFLRDFAGTDITFLQWLIFGLPFVALMIPIMFGYLWLRYRPKITNEEMKAAKNKVVGKIEQEHEEYGWIEEEQDKTKKNQTIVGIVFIVVFSLWLTTEFHGMHVTFIGFAGVVALFFLGKLKEEDLSKINWNALLTFGGGLTLGYVMLNSGLAEWLAMNLSVFRGIPPILILFIIAFVTLILTSVASNTASASILIPIMMPVGLILGINPLLTALTVAITCSVGFSTVVGTPPTIMAYSTGYFSTKEIFHIGILLDLIGIIIVTLLSLFFYSAVVNWLW